MLWCKVLRTLTRAHQSRKCPTQVLRRRCAYRACCCARCSGPQEMSKHSRRAPTKDAPESHRSLHHMRAWTDGQPEHVQRRRVVIHVKAQRKPTRRALKGGNCKHLHTHGASKSCHHLVGEESATWFSSATCPSKEQWHIPRLQQASIDQSSRAKFKSKDKDKNLLQMQRGLLLAHKAPHGQRSSPCTGCASKHVKRLASTHKFEQSISPKREP